MGISAKSYVRSVMRALQILETLDNSHRGLRISEIGRRLNIPKSSAHLITLTLESIGYVKRDPLLHNYSLGLKAYSLGREMIQSLHLPEVSLPHLKWLSNKTKLTVHLAVLEKDQAIYIQKVDGPGLIRFDTYVGKRTNLHCTAVGKVLLAYSVELNRRAFLSKYTLGRHTKKTITLMSLLRKELDKVRERGYAVDDQEEELEVRCLAVPVISPTGECLASLGVTGTLGQIQADNFEQLAAVLRGLAEKIKYALGHGGRENPAGGW